MPLRTVNMTSRDPIWMTPFVKYILRVKSRVSKKNDDRLIVLFKRITEVTNQNIMNSLKGIGTRDWWKQVEYISQRHTKRAITLDHCSLRDLNTYFGNFCTDDTYVNPELQEIIDDIEIPLINEWQVSNSRRHIKRIAIGPESIPYTVWKGHAELLARVLTKV